MALMKSGMVHMNPMGDIKAQEAVSHAQGRKCTWCHGQRHRKVRILQSIFQ